MNSTIYTNMDSVRNYNVFNQNATNASKAMTRATTGLKIASAKDGGSQYAISQKMLERINANNQSSQNVQTDNALTRTASEGVANTVDILKTLRARAIDAANDSNSASDRLTIQNDIDKLIAQIDYNASAVKFNGKTLLDGTFDERVLTDTHTAYALKMETSQSGKQISEVLGIATDQKAQLIVSWADSTGKINTKTLGTDGVAANTNLDAAISTSALPLISDSVDTIVAITEGSSTGLLDIGGGAIDSPINGFMAMTTEDSRAAVSGRFSGLTVKLVSMADSSKSVSYSFDTLIQRGKGANADAKPLAFQIGESSGMSIELSIGDMSAGASGLGISSLSVKTKDDASGAISVIDNALSVALKQQTDIGAMEERLGFVADSLDTINENLQASASAIQDADMAKEISEYMKWNVLMQSSQYMLAQSNQNAFSVLNLLQ